MLHYGNVPQVDTATWTFDVMGLVERPFALTYEELLALPRKTVMCDMHCVTRWSRLDNAFEGVPVQLVLERAGVKPAAQYCLVSAEQGFTTNLPLTDLDRPGNLIALTWNGEPLAPEHGWPARLLVPHLYLWKSAKWVRGLTLLDADVPGFWEQNGYHMRGDPEQETVRPLKRPFVAERPPTVLRQRGSHVSRALYVCGGYVHLDELLLPHGVPRIVGQSRQDGRGHTDTLGKR